MKSLAFLPALFVFAVSVASAQENYGTIKVTTRLHEDGTKSTTIVDPEKHTAEETFVNAANKVVKKITYLLGENDVSIGAIFYDAKGSVTYKASYVRDGANRITETSFTSADGKFLGKRVFVYSGGNGTAATQVVDYDANGQQIASAQPVGPKGKATKSRR
ncbi:MAG TPA: hypothetical protein VK961_15285 [Chthoniobacter sp.]|nr:hypothetical protein [Chthoniobacter sp.]